jgi:hypothetical protein
VKTISSNINMKPNHEQNRRASAAIVKNRNQPPTWLVLLSPLLRYVNMRALALVMFVGFAVLNTTRGNDAKTTEPALAENTETQVIDSRHHEDAQAAKGPTNYTPSTPLILWQFLATIVKDFERALNDRALIQYAKEQGADTSDSPAPLCQQSAPQSTTSPAPPSTY